MRHNGVRARPRIWKKTGGRREERSESERGSLAKKDTMQIAMESATGPPR